MPKRFDFPESIVERQGSIAVGGVEKDTGYKYNCSRLWFRGPTILLRRRQFERMCSTLSPTVSEYLSINIRKCSLPGTFPNIKPHNMCPRTCWQRRCHSNRSHHLLDQCTGTLARVPSLLDLALTHMISSLLRETPEQ